jgi:hypothetical protein
MKASKYARSCLASDKKQILNIQRDASPAAGISVLAIIIICFTSDVRGLISDEAVEDSRTERSRAARVDNQHVFVMDEDDTARRRGRDGDIS